MCTFHLSCRVADLEAVLSAVGIAGYDRNIHSIADLMILTKSNTFVGEFNSNWGRVVRIFRTQLNDMYVMPDRSFGWKELLGLSAKEEIPVAKEERPVLLHDIRIAFAEEKPVPPPGW